MSKTNFAEISIAVMTINRPENFVHKVIAHLPKDHPVRLIVGSPDYDYLQRYRGNPCIEIIGVDLREWEQVGEFQTTHRASWNYWRCFSYGTRPEARKGLLILEDDVIPAKRWEARLEKTIDEIEAQYGELYVLSLYTSYTELPKPVGGNKYYTHYPRKYFFGNQAMYYPEPFRAAYTEYLKREAAETYRTNIDFLLRIYLKQTGIPLLVTIPCLFQHIGSTGTGQWGQDGGWRLHTAGQFMKALPKEA
ncbi:MAG: hypothetical protein ACLQU3_14215 [Limisphaerales bacterium]